MPKGPFGRDRPFGIGPFVSKTEKELFVRRMRRLSEGPFDLVEMEEGDAVSTKILGPSPQVLETSVVVIKPDDSKVDHGQFRTQIYNADTQEELERKKEELRAALEEVIGEELPFLEKTNQLMHDGVRGNKVGVRMASLNNEDDSEYWGHLAFGEVTFDKAGDVAASFKRKVRQFEEDL